MQSDIRKKYDKNGFVLIENFLSEHEVKLVAETVDRFHKNWIVENEGFYKEKAINSAYLTGKKHLGDQDRLRLFEFVSSDKLLEVVQLLPFNEPAFMNTQLFFDPVNPDQENYWHRDAQYHLSIEQQKNALDGPEVLHFRVALKDEPGVELVPGSHKHWDSEEELSIRLEQSNKKNHDDLTTGFSVPLKKGDLLVFSANMIHRGHYGNERMSLDILFCEAQPEFFEFADVDCFPDQATIEKLENPIAMRNAVRTMSKRIKSK